MTFEFRADREAHLRTLCEEMGRTPDDFINEAVLRFMEDYEDGRDAHGALGEMRTSGEAIISLEEYMRQNSLDPEHLTESKEAAGWAGSTQSDSDTEVFIREAAKAA